MTGPAPGEQRRLAVIGAGGSGLVCLKHAQDELPDWELCCFEQTGDVTGCWGNPYPGFVSTSTKYTTQFACAAEFPGDVAPDNGASREEFFRNDEYGRYLERFADRFDLWRRIQFNTRVERFERDAESGGWRLLMKPADDAAAGGEWRSFDALIVCSGLHAAPLALPASEKTLSGDLLLRPCGLEEVVGRRVVVVGGGELAVDFANRLARPELGNTVFLSLRSGVRVSPRYHPIRGVPSDFLRNRLLLSIHEDLRNRIGQRFVEFRIRHQERMERWFPADAPRGATDESDAAAELRKHWTLKLTLTAKDDLFNMFHNKSDDFLAAVGEQRITIVGPLVDDGCQACQSFDRDDRIETNAEVVVPAVGRRCALGRLSGGTVRLSDFYLGCRHQAWGNLFLVGFARPIIGNIPTISEMQARYVVGVLSGRVQEERDIAQRHSRDQAARRRRFAQIDHDAIYPVEMFPYCDQLARRLGVYPSLRRLGLRRWLHAQLTPATTLHYFPAVGLPAVGRDATPLLGHKVFMPPLLIALLLALKPVDAIYRGVSQVRRCLLVATGSRSA